MFLEAAPEGSAVFKASSFELSELIDSLVSLVKLGVTDINFWVLSLLRLCLQKNFFDVFNEMMITQKLDYFVDLANGLLLQALPDMLSD